MTGCGCWWLCCGDCRTNLALFVPFVGVTRPLPTLPPPGGQTVLESSAVSPAPQLHYCCFPHKSQHVRALRTKQMELVGSRRLVNHASFDRTSYSIILPRSHLGTHPRGSACHTICGRSPIHQISAPALRLKLNLPPNAKCGLSCCGILEKDVLI